MDTVRIKYMDGERVTVIVPTEGHDGIWEHCYIDFRRCWEEAAWDVRISDGLIKQAPEAVHAALGLALMELKKVTP
jgi:hypothetical protein